jgi:serine/threonine-protein kinase RsbW
MAQNDILKLAVPNKMSYLAVIQQFVHECAHQFGFHASEIARIELAVEEAVINVIQHAFEPGEHSSFDVICEQVPFGIEVRIKDKGIPFDPTQVASYDPTTLSEESPAKGLGTFLMKESVDKVTYVNLGMEGKEIRLLKHIPQKNIQEYFPAADLEVEAAPPPPQIIQEKIPYDVRRMRPEEAIQVSRCAYKSHGYTFFASDIYYPERIVELNHTEELISVVAATKDNVFMGHAALHYPRVGARIAEFTYVFVNIEYRGQGCMTRLAGTLFGMEKKYPLAGLYVNSVTNHLFTQKVIVKYGINDCGIYLAASPGSWVFKGISEESKQRLSVVLSFKYLEPAPQLVLFPPEAHRAIVEKIYRNIGAENNVYQTPTAAGASVTQAQTVLRTEVFVSENCAEIWIDQYGQDFEHQARATLMDLRVKQVGAIYIYLSLEKPQTYALAAELEKLGFFFCGVLPRTDIGDTLILQYLNNVALDYSQIQVLTDMGKELMAYIRQRDPNAA